MYYGLISLMPKTAATQYIVELYSPLAAYGLLRLSSTSTNVIRVRRSSDNTEQDIGLVGDVLDTAALDTFVGANSGYVVTEYDQSGNGKHRRQSNASRQPIIVNAGVLVTISGKPAYNITPTRYMSVSGTTSEQIKFVANDRIDSFSVFQQIAATFILYTHVVDNAFFNIIGQSGSGASVFTGTVTVDNHYKNNSAVTITTRAHAYTNLATNVPLIFSQINYKNSTQAINSYSMSGYGGFEMSGNYGAWLVFSTDQSANRSAINTILNDYYGIY